MSNLEKLVTVARNQEKVYHAGAIKFAAVEKSKKSEFVTVTDSSDYKLIGLEVEGKTEQVQYSGKNLFDGGFDLGGLNINTGEQNANTSNLRSDFIDLGTGTYTISGLDGYSWYVVSYNNDKSFGKYIGMNAIKVTLEGSERYIRIMIYNNTTKPTGVMIEPGSTATEYEPYVGGQPSPNPSYPQEIVNAGKTKNLFDIYKISNFTDAGIINNGDGSLSVSKYATGSKETLNDICPDLVVGKTYTLSMITEGVGLIFLEVAGVVWNIGESKIVTEDILKSHVYFYNDANGSSKACIIKDIMLNEGSATLPYEPYGYRVNCTAVNKNFWDAEYASDKNNWTTSSTRSGYSTLKLYVGEGNSATLHYDATLTTGLDTYAVLHNITQDVWFYHSDSTPNIRNTATLVSTDGYIYVDVATYSLNTFLGIFNDILQIELGTESTDYQQNQSKQFTLTSDRPISKWDKLVKRDGVWGWSIYGINLEIDDTVNWKAYDDSNGFSAPVFSSAINKRAGYSNILMVIADYYPSTMGPNTLTLGRNNTAIYVVNSSFYDASLSDKGLANWKAHLNENPLEIWTYADEEQSFIPLPENEQKLLNKLTTYLGGTNIYTDQGCPIQIEYVADPDIYMSNGGES